MHSVCCAQLTLLSIATQTPGMSGRPLHLAHAMVPPLLPLSGQPPSVHILYAIALLMFHTVAALKVSTSQLSTSTASSQSPALCCGFPVPHTSSCFVWSQQRAFASCVPDQPPFLPRGGLLGALVRAWHLGATGCLLAKTVNL